MGACSGKPEKMCESQKLQKEILNEINKTTPVTGPGNSYDNAIRKHNERMNENKKDGGGNKYKKRKKDKTKKKNKTKKKKTKTKKKKNKKKKKNYKNKYKKM